jgi:hypothetical protein
MLAHLRFELSPRFGNCGINPEVSGLADWLAIIVNASTLAMRMMLDLRIFFHVERETVKAFIFNLNPPADGGFGRETRVQVAAALEGEERASSLISIPSSCRSRRSCGAPARVNTVRRRTRLPARRSQPNLIRPCRHEGLFKQIRRDRQVVMAIHGSHPKLSPHSWPPEPFDATTARCMPLGRKVREPWARRNCPRCAAWTALPGCSPARR